MSERSWEDAWSNEPALRARLPVGSRWRHRKRGTTYAITELALFQDASGSGEHDMELVVIYFSDNRHKLCTRRAAEFLDGRFERLPDTPTRRRQPAGIERDDEWND